MRLPGAEKDHNGMIIKAGDMLVFPAGFAPIYGKQILFFLDPKFLERSKIPAPDESDILHDPAEEIPIPNEQAIDLDAEMEELEEGEVYEDEEY